PRPRSLCAAIEGLRIKSLRFGWPSHRLWARGFGSHHQDKNQPSFGDLQTLQREGLQEENRFATWCLCSKRLDSLLLFLPLDPPLIDDFDAINLALACFVAGKILLGAFAQYAGVLLELSGVFSKIVGGGRCHCRKLAFQSS